MLHKLNQLSEKQLSYVLAIVAGLFAWRVLYIQHGWINDDSTLYFEMAKRFTHGEWHAGWELFKWPFYPLLITAMHKITPLGLYASAQLLAVMFYAICIWSLSQLITRCGGDKLAMLCGSLLLLSNVYISGDVLAMLLRDQGFWAFLLLSLVYFVRYTQEHQWADALLWQVFILIAALFRIEAMAYAAILPLYLLWQPATWRAKRQRLFTAYLLFIVLAFGGLASILLAQTNTADLGRLNEVKSLFSGRAGLSLDGLLQEKSRSYAQVLGGFLDDYATFGLILTLLSVVVIKCVSIAGAHCMVLALYARKQLTQTLSPQIRQILIILGSIALLNATIIIFRSFVLSGRYIIAFGFVVIVVAGIYLSQLIQTKPAASKKQKILLTIIALMMILGVVKNLMPKRKDYNYEQDAVAWIKAKQPQSHIFYGSARLRFYADAPWAPRGDDLDQTAFIRAVDQTNTPPYDCLVMRAEKDQAEQLAALTSMKHYHELKRVTNRSGNHVIVLCRNEIHPK